MMIKASFIESLISSGILTDDDAQNLLQKNRGNPYEILEHLLKGGAAPKERLGKLWGDSIGVAYVNLDKTIFQSLAVKRLPETFARKNYIIPLYQIQDIVTVASRNPSDTRILDAAAELMNCQISSVFSFPEEIIDAIDIHYQSDDSIAKLIGRIAESSIFKGTSKITVEQLQEIAGDQSVIEFARGILLLAVKERASDIHIDPQEEMALVRFRIDGVLHDRLKLDKTLMTPLISRLKLIANLDITEKRRPQDGRVSIALTNKSIDYRLSSLPTIYGEKIVLRILGKVQKDEIPDLTELNFSKSNLAKMRRILASPNGVFFVTGPTGSGKSTTLFSALQSLNKPDVNIMTAEDPVEYRLKRVNQIQVNSAIGFDFAAALRSFLRQDPDIILIGEIRDAETAKIAAQAALTGHFVLSTMHTNSALQAITRLVEIGVEPFLVAPSIIGVMAQKLVRKICKHCKTRYRLSPEEVEKYFIVDNPQEAEVYFYKGGGCPECNGIGYSGRLAIHEIFVINEDVRALIAKNASIIEIQEAAKRANFNDMGHDAMKKVLRGLTTIDEVAKIAVSEI